MVANINASPYMTVEKDFAFGSCELHTEFIQHIFPLRYYPSAAYGKLNITSYF